MPSVIKVKGTEASITTADNIGTATLVRLYNASAAGILITHKKGSDTIGTFTAGPGQSFCKKDPTDTLTAASAVLMVGVAHYTQLYKYIYKETIMNLITEHLEELEVITEAKEGGGKNYYIEGIFMQGDIKNRNGRIYPSATLETEMARYNKEFIQTKRALGELGHPDGPQINGDRVSHLITEMRREGNDFYGKAKILGTPMGEIVKSLLDEGVKIGVSTRGLGSVKAGKDGVMEVQKDFHLSTVDIVTDPSAPNAFVNGIMENVEYYYDIASGNWQATQMVEEIAKIAEKKYNRITKTIDEVTAAKMFESFVRSLRN